MQGMCIMSWINIMYNTYHDINKISFAQQMIHAYKDASNAHCTSFIFHKLKCEENTYEYESPERL